MDINQKSINTLRALSVEEIEKANSGHPGICLGSAPIVYALYGEIMNYNPKNSSFVNRDRFVLSAGHGSALLYAVLHMFGFKVSKTDLMNFRQYGSVTPGHPEYGVTDGVEVSTGPLGQGIANAVGMALAESMLASKYNKPGYKIVDHYTYALCGDGCMQEGIENEAASFAGTNKLGKLIVFYDKNNITIEGKIDTAFDEDVGARHEALGWQVINVKDGNDVSDIKSAVAKAKREKDKPSLIIVNTHIGYGSPLADSASCHGSPIKGNDLAETLKNLGMEGYEKFEIPEDVAENVSKKIEKRAECEAEWNDLLRAYERAYPDLARDFVRTMKGELPELDSFYKKAVTEKEDATRNNGNLCITELGKIVPTLAGGSADLAPSTKAFLNGEEYYSPLNRSGRNIHFGIREHAMGAISNGMYLHGGLRPFCSTFFVFSDYMRNAIRMSAIMKLPVIYVLSHDSIGVGEDGPTHEPVEQLSSLRVMPDLNVIRPCDSRETAVAYKTAITAKRPTCIVLSRQNLPQYKARFSDIEKGGYILADSVKEVPDAIIIATGSEVGVAMSAKEMLKKKKIDVRVVSMPCVNVFEEQTKAYKEKVLPSAVTARVAVEAGATAIWYKYVGLNGKVIGIDTFGASGKAETLFEAFGITAENVCGAVKSVIKK